jgi:hypothetical protein
MKTVSCTLKLAQDANNPNCIRECDLSIQGDSSQSNGTWTLTNDSTDPRLAIGAATGSWFVFDPLGSRSGDLEISDSNLILLAILNGVPTNVLAQITCGNSLSGQGWHPGPPQSDLVYSLDFLCA